MLVFAPFCSSALIKPDMNKHGWSLLVVAVHFHVKYTPPINSQVIATFICGIHVPSNIHLLHANMHPHTHYVYSTHMSTHTHTTLRLYIHCTCMYYGDVMPINGVCVCEKDRHVMCYVHTYMYKLVHVVCFVCEGDDIYNPSKFKDRIPL